VQALQQRDLIFCVGPAGTGKTFLAAMVGVQALMNGDYERLILTRPAVEAGERLGFLPGDLQQKVNPYLRPLYDALHELIDPEKIPSLMERGVIEVAPLAYMRGRTLNNAFVILDEAQNTTPSQMKMVLTRLGFKSRMVVTGDTTQTDLPETQASGLSVAQRILGSVEGIAFCKLTPADVIRHPLVQRIVTAYEKYESKGPKKP
jgi:phosphate starvation-inducible PhoH-like protein